MNQHKQLYIIRLYHFCLREFTDTYINNIHSAPPLFFIYFCSVPLILLLNKPVKGYRNNVSLSET